MFIPDYYIQIFTKPVDKGGLGYKASSMDTFNYNLRKLFYEAFAAKGGYSDQYPNTPEGRKSFYKKAKFFPYYLNRKEDMMAAIMGLPESQQLQYLFIVKTIYENWGGKDASILKFYNEEYEKLKAKRQDITTLAPPSEKQVNNTISEAQYDAVLKKYDELAAKPTADVPVFLRRLILALYKYIPPLRPQDYVNTSYKGEVPDATNYIDMEKKELVIKEGKRTNEANSRVIPIPDPLFEIIKQTKEKLGSKWLIPMATNKEYPMERTAFTHFLQNTFKKENLPAYIGAARLRTMKVSKMVDDGASAKELKETAKTMGHTPATQLTVYTKNSERLHGERPADNSEAINKLASEVAAMRKDIEYLQNLNKMLVKLLVKEFGPKN